MTKVESGHSHSSGFTTPIGFLLAALWVVCPGCGSGEADKNPSAKKSTPAPAEPAEPEPAPRKKDRITQLCDDLDIKKRVGLFPKNEEGEIIGAMLQESGVRDISPLKGLPLKTLQLNYTSVYDLSPIAEMPLEYLNLQGTPVKDIGPVQKLPLNTLWLNRTRVADLSPLKGKTLVSLDITGTAVSDLSPLRGMTSLRRLNLSDCRNVTDLTPLEGLQLERLTFNPERIKRGIDAVRKMKSIRTLHTRFPGGRPFPPAAFWQAYDSGTLPRAGETR